MRGSVKQPQGIPALSVGQRGSLAGRKERKGQGRPRWGSSVRQSAIPTLVHTGSQKHCLDLKPGTFSLLILFIRVFASLMGIIIFDACTHSPPPPRLKVLPNRPRNVDVFDGYRLSRRFSGQVPPPPVEDVTPQGVVKGAGDNSRGQEMVEVVYSSPKMLTTVSLVGSFFDLWRLDTPYPSLVEENSLTPNVELRNPFPSGRGLILSVQDPQRGTAFKKKALVGSAGFDYTVAPNGKVACEEIAKDSGRFSQAVPWG